MTTLGDSLLAKGQLYAAQFCYIVSVAEWGTFAKKGSKLVLLCAQVYVSLFLLLSFFPFLATFGLVISTLLNLPLSGWGLDSRPVCYNRGNPMYRSV